MKTVVVGVDGSKCAEAALDFAVDEAAMRSHPLLIVSAWEVPDGASFWATTAIDTLESAKREAEKIGEGATERALQLQPLVPVASVIRSGRPDRVLLEEASEADLLVVGKRGRGAVAGLLLGSVSQRLVQLAPCPVIVVPPAAADC